MRYDTSNTSNVYLENDPSQGSEGIDRPGYFGVAQVVKSNETVDRSR